MPLRLALTGRTAGPDVPDQLAVLGLAPAAKVAVYEPLDCRMAQLKKWASSAGGATAPSSDGASSDDAPTPVKADAPAPLTFETFAALRPIYEAHRRSMEDDKSMYDVLVAEHGKLQRAQARAATA